MSLSSIRYLLTIRELNQELQKIKSKDIADKLGYSKPSITRAINNLVTAGLVERNNGIELTKEGEIQSSRFLCCVNYVKEALCKILDMPMRFASNDALNIVGALSEQGFERLCVLLEFDEDINEEHPSRRTK